MIDGDTQVVIFICHIYMEYRWAKEISDAQYEAYAVDLDFSIERELGPWPSRDGWFEETEVEMVPVEMLP